MAIGGTPVAADLSGLFYRKDSNAYVYALGVGESLPAGLATLAVSVRDRAGNLTEKKVTFNVAAASAGAPQASFTTEPIEGKAPLEVRFSGGASADAGGTVMRWEWYFGDGMEALGPEVSHLYEDPGIYESTLLVRDNDGLVSTTTRTVTVRSSAPPRFRRADSNCDGAVDVADAIVLLTWLFSNGPSLCCEDAADANGDLALDLSDALFVLFWRFAGAGELPPPGPFDCGTVAGGDGLGCDAYPESRC